MTNHNVSFPTDILQSISSYLLLKDFYHLGCVCSSWSNALLHSPHQWHLQYLNLLEQEHYILDKTMSQCSRGEKRNKRKTIQKKMTSIRACQVSAEQLMKNGKGSDDDMALKMSKSRVFDHVWKQVLAEQSQTIKSLLSSPCSAQLIETQDCAQWFMDKFGELENILKRLRSFGEPVLTNIERLVQKVHLLDEALVQSLHILAQKHYYLTGDYISPFHLNQFVKLTNFDGVEYSDHTVQFILHFIDFCKNMLGYKVSTVRVAELVNDDRTVGAVIPTVQAAILTRNLPIVSRIVEIYNEEVAERIGDKEIPSFVSHDTTTQEIVDYIKKNSNKKLSKIFIDS